MSPLLAYVHPLLAALALVAALVVLSLGLKVRDARLRRRTAPREARAHVLVAPWVAWALAFAFALGPISSTLLRGWRLLDTVHGWAGLVAAACFVSSALLGRRLRVRPGARRSLHGNLGLLGMLAGLVAALTGLELLP